MPKAITLLKDVGKVEAVSSVWRSAAVGSPGPAFLNIAILFLSSLSSRELRIQVLQEIEKQMGRIRTSDKNATRTIDIDILVSGSEELDASIWEQAYLAVPLAEIHPHYRHPATGESIETAAQRLISHSEISIAPTIITE